MSSAPPGPVHDASAGGMAASHPETASFQILAAPSTADESNTVQMRLVPIACWRVDDIRFAFDSSFVTPDIATEIQALADLRELKKKIDPLTGQAVDPPQFPPLSIFGHADPVGPAVAPDEYNKALSGRRATAIYALLIVNTDPDGAVNLWRTISSTENWGADQKQMMQANVPDGTSDSDLFQAYMKKLCPDGLELTSKDFLAQGADSGGKGDYQGCSSFNPLLIFSQQTEDGFEQAAQNQDQADLAARNRANAPNRRVMILLFQVGSQISPTKWPCPRATEATAGCTRRFWSDGQSRRTTRLPDQDRKFEDTHDTFACRFYQRISDGSPCHQTILLLRLRLFDRQARPLPQAPFVVTIPGRTVSGFTDSNGDALVQDVELPATCVVRWSRASSLLDSSLNPPDSTWKDFEFEHTVSVGLNAPATVSTFADLPVPAGADPQRLWNMGYIFRDTQEANIQAFQQDAGLSLSGSLTDASSQVREHHDVLVAPPPPSLAGGTSLG